MARKRQPAREVVKDRGDGDYWIDHAVVEESDREWLVAADWLTLWNVHVPDGFLATLTNLKGLDIRGGSRSDLSLLEGCTSLRCLEVNQVQGLADLSMVETLDSLEILSLYGLRQVVQAPSLQRLSRLRRLEVGQMRGLDGLGGLLDAPGLTELFIIKRVHVTSEDVARIKASAVERFGWYGEDTPVSMWGPVVEELGLPEPAMGFPKDLLAAADKAPAPEER